MRSFSCTLLFTLFSLGFISCSDNEPNIPDGGADNPDNQGVVNNILNNASIEWGKTRLDIISYMEDYNLVQGTSNDVLQFTTSKGKQSISYSLKDDKLIATAIILPTSTLKMDIQSMLNGYTFVGELDGGMVYEKLDKNTLATIWKTVGDGINGAIGLAPIISDAYTSVPEIMVTTNNAVADAISASISGSVTGVSSNVEVGVIYGLSNDLTELNGLKESTFSQNSFSLDLKGLVDDTTYYYRAYAMIDDIYYLGDIQSFVTKQLTYTIDGQTFKMIRVVGGPNGDFSIMQTELPPNCHLIINSVEIGCPQILVDNAVSESEFSYFLDRLQKRTGITFNLPTQEEWLFAARGGQKGQNFNYSGSNSIDDVAWYKGNCNSVQPVAQKKPNELELYDMSGNYSEVCRELQSRVVNGIYLGVNGPICGGSWADDASNCKVDSWKEGKKYGTIPSPYSSGSSELVAFDCRTSTIRLIYYRNHQSEQK